MPPLMPSMEVASIAPDAGAPDNPMAPLMPLPPEVAPEQDPPAVAQVTTSPSDAGVDSGGAPSSSFPADWCDRLDSSDAVLAAYDIVDEYAAAQSMNCATAGLTVDLLMDEEHNQLWLDYLEKYTFLMAGCVPSYETVAGGISVFGPANTAFVDVARAPLSPNEAHLLIDDYVEAFANGLGLTPEEQEAVRAYLLQVATPEIDLAATGTLSTCAVADAGQ